DPAAADLSPLSLHDALPIWPRPTVLLFHGCGGLRAHLPRYAEAAKATGWRAVIVDSYAPRGWSRAFTLTAVCTGLALRGYERARSEEHTSELQSRENLVCRL